MMDISERKALFKAIAGTVKEFVAAELKPILDRIEILENHSESSSDAVDSVREKVAALDLRLTAQAANLRRGLQ